MHHELIALPRALALPIGITAVPRAAIESLIELMIDALDAADGDADFEPDVDAEPLEGVVIGHYGVDQSEAPRIWHG